MSKINTKRSKVEEVESIEKGTTPMFDEKIYYHLPKLLQEACNYINKGRQKDVMLLSTISILSGCIRGIEGQYHQSRYYTNVNAFIIAPPASGKGVMQKALKLADKLHAEITSKSDNRWSQNLDNDSPVLLIPGSASKVSIVNHLKSSNSCGIICETEADSLSSSIKQKWGDFSDIIRKTFHHEQISHSTKNDGYSYINKPRLSTLLTGTPNQVASLIESQENGLFSRFIYYTYEDKEGWLDGFKYADIDFEKYYQSISASVFELSKFSYDNPSMFNFTDEQKNDFNDLFRKQYEKYESILGAHGLGVVKRMAINFFRIAMILTELDRFENKETSKSVICSQSNFEIVRVLINVLFKHSYEVMSKLPTNENFDKYSEFMNKLPESFTRKDAIDICEGLVTGRTVDNWLDDLKSTGRIFKVARGKFEKKE